MVAVWVCVEELVNDFLIGGPLRAPLPISVILHFAVREVPHGVVDKHIAWATVPEIASLISVPRDRMLGSLPVNHGVNTAFRIRRNDAEIGDATNVLTNPPLCRVVK
jgi:hypothetical protein